MKKHLFSLFFLIAVSFPSAQQFPVSIPSAPKFPISFPHGHQFPLFPQHFPSYYGFFDDIVEDIIILEAITGIQLAGKLELEGKIKSINEFTYKASMKKGHIIKRNKWLFKKSILYETGNKVTNLSRYKYVSDKSRTFLISDERLKYNEKGDLIEENTTNHANIVKICSKYTYKHDTLGRVIEKRNINKSGKVDDREVYKYDADGNLIELIDYDDEGDDIDRKWLYHYDQYGNCTKKIEIDEDGDKEITTKKYKYDNDGRIIEWVEYNSDSEMEDKEINKYDGLGRLVENIDYDEDGKIQDIDQYKYDSRNRLIEKLKLDEKGIIEDRDVFIYDDKNRLRGKDGYDEYGKIEKKYFNFIYDDTGNWIQRTYMVGNNKYSVIKREIEYYPE